MNEYEVWVEGFAATGQRGTAFQIINKESQNGKWKAESFEQACQDAIMANDMIADYNEERNTWWGCSLFDNASDARKSFG